ncbi:MAG: type IV pilus secretin PilQ family protein [Moraxella sp.]|nr:type IV pilus secretin PilQ family protein [Moraxella sp.]
MTLRNPKATFVFSALAIGVAAISSQAYANQIQGITATQATASTTQLRVHFDSNPVLPVAYQQAGSNQLILDFNQVGSGSLPRNTAVNTGVVRDITTLSNGTTTRLIANLSNAANYSTRIESNQLVIDVADLGVATPMSASTTTAAVATNPMVVQVNPLLVPANARNNSSSYEGFSAVNYSANAAGGGDINIALTNEAIPVDVQRQGNKIIVRTTGAKVPQHLLRRLNAGGLVTSIDANNQGQNGIITINMSADYEYQAYQAGSSLNISVRPADLLREPTLEEKVYKGEPLSMEFQDVSVRTVLDVLAQFTDMNVVASDAVTGNITLRLINVPWDQALDIILTSKNLDKRVNGNVMVIGPAEALAQQETNRLKAQQEVKTLAPLRTEYIRLNYAKAADMHELLDKANSSSGRSGESQTSLFSPRGSATFDGRTNTIILKDTAESINNIRGLIEKIDIPVKQVMIEARIVNATDGFTKELGVSWGLLSDRGNLSIGGSQTTLWDIRTGRRGGDTTTTIERPANLSVDLGATNPAGRIALGLLNLPNFALDLELSAMQADNRGEVISSPKVLTADKQTAKISSGVQVPYQEASASGATTTSFKEAALALEVTPNITPEGKIALELLVNNADLTGEFSNGVPIIREDSVNTNVMLEDGQTVVLGGVFRNTIRNNQNKVPFLGDLPMLGRLFRNEVRENTKSELLIFITPRLVNDGVSRIN